MNLFPVLVLNLTHLLLLSGLTFYFLNKSYDYEFDARYIILFRQIKLSFLRKEPLSKAVRYGFYSLGLRLLGFTTGCIAAVIFVDTTLPLIKALF